MDFSFSVKPVKLHPTNTFEISREAKSEVENCILKLSVDGTECFGEAAPNKYYGELSGAVLIQIKRLMWELQGRFPDEPDEIYEIWNYLAFQTNSMAALSAVDILLWDYVAKRNEQPLWKLLGNSMEKNHITSVTVPLAEPDEMVQMAEGLKDYPILKVKIDGHRNADVIARIRDVYKGKIRLDANCSLEPAKLGSVLEALAPHDIEFMEQPLPPKQNEAMKKFKESSPFPLYADESCAKFGDLWEIKEGFHGVNIKLAKCGGITPTLKMIDGARDLELGVMIGCMLETGIGVSASLSSSYKSDHLDLDGNWLLKENPFEGQLMGKGAFTLTKDVGLGVDLADDGLFG